MTMISGHVPFRFYQVKDEGLTIEVLCEKFNVTPERVEREIKDQSAPLQRGEMLVIHD